MVDAPAELLRCPGHIMIVGGGRWARQVIDVLCELVPSSTEISIYSRHSKVAIEQWVGQRASPHRLRIFSELSLPAHASKSAAIVVNAARRHREVAEWMIDVGIPLIVEKPIASSSTAARDLTERAD